MGSHGREVGSCGGRRWVAVVERRWWVAVLERRRWVAVVERRLVAVVQRSWGG